MTAVTTSSVTLNWTQPEGNVSWYTVQWTASGHNFSKTTNQTFFAITDLKPGFQYKITVAAVAVDSLNEGEGTAITTFTSRSIENVLYCYYLCIHQPYGCPLKE